jgi:hypothetical protein
MKIRNKDEKVIKCANFKDIAEGECFYDEHYDVIMMKVGKVTALNLDSGFLVKYPEQSYLPLVNAEIVWEFEKE